ncbi:MAG: hypothetical protein WBC91_23280 [Phototrophicaceae bacterium]
MVYLFYTEDSLGNIAIYDCPDLFHYMDTFYTIEAEGRMIPYDIHWHGSTTIPEMRILALSTIHLDLTQNVDMIVQQCSLWLRQN